MIQLLRHLYQIPLIQWLWVEPARQKKIFAIGLPIIGGMLSQSIVNLIDAAIVGQLGSKALAGVGIGGYAAFMVTATAMGLSSAVQASVARRKGENNETSLASPINDGMLLAIIFSLPIMAFFYSIAPQFIQWLNQDPDVQAIATPYFRVRLLGLFSTGLMLVFRGYWNGTNRSGIFLRIQIITHCINIPLTYCLVYGSLGMPNLGTTGSAIGTVVSLYIGTLICFLVTGLSAQHQGFLTQKPKTSSVWRLFRLSAPHSIQQFIFAIGITVLLWIIGKVSTDALAIGHVLIHLSLLLILPSVGLGLAATSLVGQALGRNDPKDAHHWGWDVVKTAMVLMFLVGLPLWVMPESILGLFTSDQTLIALGSPPLTITGFCISLEVTALVLTQALLGAGANTQVMKISLGMQWLVFLPCAWLVGPFLGYGLIGIWLVQTCQRTLSSLIFAHLWNQKHWTHIRL